MNSDILDELEDAFIDQKDDSHFFVWTLIRGLCKDAKMGKLNKTCVYNEMGPNGQPKKDSIKLKGIKVVELPSNPNWLPPKMEASDVGFYEHKVTDKTWEYLTLYSSFMLLRHQKWAESIEKFHEESIRLTEERLEKETSVEAKVQMRQGLEQMKKQFAEERENLEKDEPTCMEQAIFNSIYPAIYQQVTLNIDKALDKENEEMYPPKDAKKPEVKK